MPKRGKERRTRSKGRRDSLKKSSRGSISWKQKRKPALSDLRLKQEEKKKMPPKENLIK